MALQPPVSSALPTYALCLVSNSESNEFRKMLRMSLFSEEGACALSLSPLAFVCCICLCISRAQHSALYLECLLL